MLIYEKRYKKAKAGTIKLQSIYRGNATRKFLSAIRIQTYFRMAKKRVAFRKLRSAMVALQCAQRKKVAKRVLQSIKSDQKDIGKLKGNNERLKTEMASLKAMLQAQAAQAQGDKGREESERVVQQKQMQIGILEARIKQLEKELDNEKSNSNGLEKEVKAQKVQVQKLLEDMQKLRKQKQEEIQNLRKQQRAIPSVQTTSDVEKRHPQAPAMQTPFSLNELAEHQAMVAKLDEELETERRFRREADGEIIKLRAQMSGVTLEDSDVDALIPKNIDQTEARTEGKDSERQGDR